MKARSVDIVVPARNEEGALTELVERVRAVMQSLDTAYRLIIVDDGSDDGTVVVCKQLQERYPEIGYIELSRNFGHQAALTAALDFADADVVITMDADLQHPPEVIPSFLLAWEAGAEIVHGVRADDSGSLSLFKRWSSRAFYYGMNLLSEVTIVGNSPDFRLLDARVVRAVRLFREQSRFLRGMFVWLGFRQVQVEYDQQARSSGQTKYRLSQMLAFGMTAVLGFSRIPLRIATVLGCLVSVAAFIYGGYAVAQRVILHRALPGWTSLAVLVSLLSGAQMLLLGLLGEYLGQVLSEVRGRPLYIVREQHIPPLRDKP